MLRHAAACCGCTSLVEGGVCLAVFLSIHMHSLVTK